MSAPLGERHCEPCHAGTPALDTEAQARLGRQLESHWRVEDGHHLVADIPRADFRGALELANRIGRLAENEGHHPELTVSPEGLTVRIWTHAIDALSTNDFILAARIDEIME